MARHRRELFIAAQVVFGAAVLYYAGLTIARQWRTLPADSLTVEPRWGILTGSAIVVLATYAILIQTWRSVLGAWGGGRTLSFVVSARIWFVSNLGRFLPGRIWQIGALAVMAQQRKISAIAATGAAVLVNLVSVLVGIAITLVFGARVLQQPGLALLAVGAGLVLVALTPVLLPRAARLVSSVTGKSIGDVSVPALAIWASALGCGVAWLLYGLAFQLLVLGTLGRAAGAWTEYVAVFAGSYVVGYLAVLAPGGLIVREGAMVVGLTTLGLVTMPEAVLMSVVSRLWLTILEVGPGALFLLRPDRGDRLTDPPSDVSSG